ncbi:MAG TPA: hypothetical protein VHS59_13990 [Bacillota bacterium]|nr:hypothetical protein [Bacillota bacterium]
MAAKEGYEAKVAVQALNRVGKNPNIKGVIHEQMFVDKFNITPSNILDGKTAHLTKSTTAVRDDVIVKQAGKIVKRLQLKDTPGSINKTIRQVADGKYQRTVLAGTKETAKQYAKKAGTKVTQKMTSTGISSETTSSIAQKALGELPTAKALANVAGKAGIAGAVISGGVEAVSSAKDWYDGTISGGEFAGRVAKEAAGGGISASAGTAAGAVATGLAGTLLATTTAPAWVPVATGVAVAVGVGTAIKKTWDWFWD